MEEVPVGALVVRVAGVEGEPIARALMVLSDVHGDFIASARIYDGKGIARPPQCEYSIDVYQATSSTGEPLPLGAGMKGGLGPEDRSVDILLGPGRVVKGKVLDGKGAPAARIVVEAYRSGHVMAGFAPPVAATTTDDRGKFELVGLGTVAYSLLLVHLGSTRVIATCEVTVDSNDVEVTLPLSVRGNPPRGAQGE